MESQAHQELRELFDRVLSLDSRHSSIPEGTARELLTVAMSMNLVQLRQQGFKVDELAGELQKRIAIVANTTLEASRMWDEGVILSTLKSGNTK